MTVSDPLPSGGFGGDLDWSITSQTGTGCSITGAVGAESLSCTLGDMAALATYTVHVSSATTKNDVGTVSNTAHVATSNDG